MDPWRQVAHCPNENARGDCIQVHHAVLEERRQEKIVRIDE
jgi:hypothetical protein